VDKEWPWNENERDTDKDMEMILCPCSSSLVNSAMLNSADIFMLQKTMPYMLANFNFQSLDFV
jgi:hypothetical protein